MGKIYTIAVSGDKGSFSELAGRTYAKMHNIELDIRHCIDMEGTLSQIELGGADIGVVPVYNSIGQVVRPAIEAMGRHNFTYIDHLQLEIDHCLMVLPSTKLSEITQIVSHEQPFLQCSDYVHENFSSIPQLNYSDMAKAATDLAKGILPKGTAVIGSEMAAEENGLEILEKKIQNKRIKNITTFIIVKKSQ